MTVNVLLDLAEHWRSRGFPTMPVALHSTSGPEDIRKRPLAPNGHLDATTEPDQLGRLFERAQGWLRSGEVLAVGVVPGAAGYVVLDCDRKKGKHGLDSLERLRAQHGEFDRYRYATPSGGLNVMCRKPPAATFSNDSPWDGIDVRADSGWIVAPGCRSPWGDWTEEYGELDDVVELPAAMAALLREATEAKPAATVDEAKRWLAEHAGPTSPNAQGAFDQRLADFIAGTGSRHERLVPLVGWVVGMRHLDHGAAFKEIRRAWNRLTEGEHREHEPFDVLLWAIAQERAKPTEIEALIEAPAPSANGASTTVDAPPVDADRELTGWETVDLAPIVVGILAGTLQRPQPTVGRLTDGTCLFYEGRVNGLAGESGCGKSWVAQYTAVQELAAGNDVLYVDLEDREDNVVGRLLALGADPDTVTARFHYVTPDRPFGDDAQAQISRLLVRTRPRFAVVDSVGEAMAVQQMKQNDDDHVALWFRRLPRWIAAHGPAVAVVDHVPKDPDRSPLYAIGSQRKRAAITGAQFMVDTVAEFGQGQNGTAKLTTAKDRNGIHVRGRQAAQFRLDATDPDKPVAEFVPPAHRASTTFRPTVLMEKISRYLEINQTELSKAAIEAAVRGRNDAKRLALELLVGEGYVSSRRNGAAIVHRFERAYRAEDETLKDLAE